MGRHPNSWKPADTSADPVIQDAMDKGYLQSGEVYSIHGFADHTAANRGRLSINRSARRQNLSPGAWVTDQNGNQCYKDCPSPDEPHSVHFRLYSKEHARQHIFQQSGGNPANLKYNPWAKGNRKRFTDDGNPEY